MPEVWDAISFAPAIEQGRDDGRDFLVITQGAWTAQRAVRFDRYLFVRTYHCGYHAFPELMLFDLEADPHEENNLAEDCPDELALGLRYLVTWLDEITGGAEGQADPMWSVLSEGGPFPVRGELPAYLERLRNTGRSHWADELMRVHPREAEPVSES